MVVLPRAIRAERRIYTSVTDPCKKDGCFEVTRASFSLRELANQWNWSSERRRRAADLDELLRATIELSRLSARERREKERGTRTRREREELMRDCVAIVFIGNVYWPHFYCAGCTRSCNVARIFSMIIYIWYHVVTHYSRLGPDRGEKSQISTSEVSAQQGIVAYL